MDDGATPTRPPGDDGPSARSSVHQTHWRRRLAYGDAHVSPRPTAAPLQDHANPARRCGRATSRLRRRAAPARARSIGPTALLEAGTPTPSICGSPPHRRRLSLTMPKKHKRTAQEIHTMIATDVKIRLGCEDFEPEFTLHR